MDYSLSHEADRSPAPATSARLERNLRRAATALSAYVLAGGLLSFLGWPLDLPRLTDWDGNGVSIQPNTAIAAACAGVALLSLLWSRRRLAAILGAVVAFIGASVILEHLSGVDLGLDALLLFGRTWGRAGVLVPGRMGPPGATSWTLLGTALILAARGRKARASASLIALATLGIALLTIIGYLYGAHLLYTLPRLTIIAMQTSTFILALSAGLIFSIPEHTPSRWLIEESAAGTFVRRTVPAILILPVVLGFLRLEGQQVGLYDLEFGTALRTLIEMALLLGLVGWTAVAIGRQSRRVAERDRRARADTERLTGLLGRMSDSFFTLDPSWRFSFINDQGLRGMEMHRDEVLGANIWELFPQAKGNDAYVQMQRAMAERVSLDYEVFCEPWQRWFAGRIYPMGDGGLAVFSRDITERKQIDESLRLSRQVLARDFDAMRRLQGVSTRLIQTADMPSLLQQILVASIEVTGSDKGNIQLYDPQTGTLRILVHQGFGSRFLEHFTEQGAPRIDGRAAEKCERVIMEDLLADPALKGSEDVQVLLEDGIRAVQSTPLISRDGRLLGMLNNHFSAPHRPEEHTLRYLDLLARMGADLIERSHIEQGLRESERKLREQDAERARLLESERSARQDLERANRIKDEFLATLSHELRSPLNAIHGWVKLLEKHASDPAILNEGIAVIARNAKAQAELISDLLDMNRIISGKMRLELSDVPLSEVITEAIDAIRPAAESKRIRLVPQLQDVPEPVRGDGSRLLQVMWNMLSNAVRFTPDGGEIRVILAKVSSHAEVVVSDTGAGIDPGFLPYIFDRFRQADASTTRMHGGLGLGLAIVKQLVEMHGGTVRAESEGEGKGARFTIRLPLVRLPLPVSALDRKQAESDGGDASRAKVTLKGVTVLAVEDQADSRNLLRMLLEDFHAKVVSAGSAEEALSILERIRPDVILCDIGMSGKDGYQFIEEVRERGDKTPALAVTAFARTEDMARALRAGYHGHIAKPIEPVQLVSTVAVFARSIQVKAADKVGSKP